MAAFLSPPPSVSLSSVLTLAGELCRVVKTSLRRCASVCTRVSSSESLWHCLSHSMICVAVCVAVGVAVCVATGETVATSV